MYALKDRDTDMRGRDGGKTVFIVELTAIFLFIVMAAVIFAQIFTACRLRSTEAARLNDSVILAESAAEAASASPTVEELKEALASMDAAEGGQCECTEDGSGGGTLWITAAAGKNGSGTGSYRIRVVRTCRPDGDGPGRYAEDTVDVFGPSDDGEPLYTLRSGTFFREEAAS